MTGHGSTRARIGLKNWGVYFTCSKLFLTSLEVKTVLNCQEFSISSASGKVRSGRKG
jgi:hypothetical protein